MTVDRDSIFANYKSVFSRQFAVSLAVEFIGVMFFQPRGGKTKLFDAALGGRSSLGFVRDIGWQAALCRLQQLVTYSRL